MSIALLQGSQPQTCIEGAEGEILGFFFKIIKCKGVLAVDVTGMAQEAVQMNKRGHPELIVDLFPPEDPVGGAVKIKKLRLTRHVKRRSRRIDRDRLLELFQRLSFLFLCQQESAFVIGNTAADVQRKIKEPQTHEYQRYPVAFEGGGTGDRTSRKTAAADGPEHQEKKRSGKGSCQVDIKKTVDEKQKKTPQHPQSHRIFSSDLTGGGGPGENVTYSGQAEARPHVQQFVVGMRMAGGWKV